MLTADEFRKQIFSDISDLEKIKLAIREDKFTIWDRPDKPNFDAEYLQPILALPESHPTKRKVRDSGGPGDPEVIEIKYDYTGMGKTVPIYVKGYFKHDGGLHIDFDIQSLRPDEQKMSLLKGGKSV